MPALNKSGELISRQLLCKTTAYERHFMNYQDQAASIVHDAKNRLQLLLPQIATLAQHEDEGVRSTATRLTQDLDEVNHQLVMMLSLYRLEQTDLVSTQEVFVADVLDGFAEKLQHRQIVIHCHRDLTVYADPRLLQAVIGDALHNALGYSKGAVSLTVSPLNQGISVTITNDLDHSAEPDSGSGVGLWIADKIARSHCRHSEQGYARFKRTETQGVFELYLP